MREAAGGMGEAAGDRARDDKQQKEERESGPAQCKGERKKERRLGRTRKRKRRRQPPWPSSPPPSSSSPPPASALPAVRVTSMQADQEKVGGRTQGGRGGA
eukprot:3461031-Rhodomonas_salina.1